MSYTKNIKNKKNKLSVSQIESLLGSGVVFILTRGSVHTVTTSQSHDTAYVYSNNLPIEAAACKGVIPGGSTNFCDEEED